MLGGAATSLATLKPSASNVSGTSAGNAEDKLLELERFDMPLGALPSGRFFLFSGERPAAELGRDRWIMSARSALKFCCACGWAGGLSVVVSALTGDWGGDDGFKGGIAHNEGLDWSSDLDDISFSPSLDEWLVFRGDRFGDTSCSGCELLRTGDAAVGAATRLLSNNGDAFSSSCIAGQDFCAVPLEACLEGCSESNGVACLLRVFDRRLTTDVSFLLLCQHPQKTNVLSDLLPTLDRHPSRCPGAYRWGQGCSSKAHRRNP